MILGYSISNGIFWKTGQTQEYQSVIRRVTGGRGGLHQRLERMDWGLKKEIHLPKTSRNVTFRPRTFQLGKSTWLFWWPWGKRRPIKRRLRTRKSEGANKLRSSLATEDQKGERSSKGKRGDWHGVQSTHLRPNLERNCSLWKPGGNQGMVAIQNHYAVVWCDSKTGGKRSKYQLNSNGSIYSPTIKQAN